MEFLRCNMNYYVGIDVGKKGSLCLLSEDCKEIEFYDFPSKDTAIGQFFNDLDKLFTTKSINLIAMEKVHSMPHQSSQSSFTFGTNYGMWLGFLMYHNSKNKIAYDIVLPQKWMKIHNIFKTDGITTKDKVKAVCQRLYPRADIFGSKGGYLDGRGDALLIANYARMSQIKAFKDV